LKADTGNKIYPAAFYLYDPAALTKGIILTPAVRYNVTCNFVNNI
jgi:hypothetical protein